MLEICSQGDYNYDYLKFDVDDFLPLNKIESHLMEHGSEYSLISFVHSETSTGVINPISEIAALVKRYSSKNLIIINKIRYYCMSFRCIPVRRCYEQFRSHFCGYGSLSVGFRRKHHRQVLARNSWTEFYHMQIGLF